MVDMQLTDGGNADGNTPAPSVSSEAAQIEAMHSEAKKGLQEFMSQATTAKPEAVQTPSTSTEEPKASVPAPAKAEENVEVLKQFQAKDGSLDENKILKSTQNLKQYHAKLQEEFKATQADVNRLENQIKRAKQPESPAPRENIPAPLFDGSENVLSPEEAKALEEAKNEPIVSALLKKLELAQGSAALARREIELEKVQKRDVAMLNRLDELSKDHPWLYTEEGQARLAETLNADKALWSTTDPYGYAVARLAKDIGSKDSSNGQARPAGTPMLGTGRAIPPSVSEAVSPAQELEKLRGSLESGIGDRSELRKVENELRRKASQLFR